MGALEIVLLIAGGIIFILSFVLPTKGEQIPKDAEKLAREEIKELVGQEMEAVRGHVDEVVEEAVGYAMEKTERSLERLSNEKIMAVNEYSDTVLAEIHKNHEEAMFLYDMLNSKHVNLKNTVSEVDRTVKEAEEKVSTFRKLVPETAVKSEKQEMTGNAEKAENAEKTVKSSKAVKKTISKSTENQEPSGRISFTQGTDEEGHNNNERILELYQQGKSRVAIAKELGLGVGEVKLVIDLFRNQ